MIWENEPKGFKLSIMVEIDKGKGSDKNVGVGLPVWEGFIDGEGV